MLTCDPTAFLQARGKSAPAGYAYQVQGGHSPYGMDVLMGEELKLDESRMGVFIPYADGNARDGVGDLIEVGGIDLSRHVKNRVALYDHGKHVTLPIGVSTEPDTKDYTVMIDQAARTAGAMTYFYQGKGQGLEGTASQLAEHAKFSYQLYDLVCKGFVRGGSIGYTITHARELPADWERGVPKGLHLLAVKQLEYSVVVMPCNQDTVRKNLDSYTKGVADAARRILSLPKVCGDRLSEVFVKSLSGIAAPRKAQLGYEGKSARPDPEMARDAELEKVAAGINKDFFLDCYGKLFFKSETGEVWFVTCDSTPEEEAKEINKRLEAVDMIHGIRMESETSPPDGEGWIQIYPKKGSKAMTPAAKPKEEPKRQAPYQKELKAIRLKYRPQKKAQEQGPYAAGYAARLASKPKGSCPYPDGSKEYQEWWAGYQKAENDLKAQGKSVTPSLKSIRLKYRRKRFGSRGLEAGAKEDARGQWRATVNGHLDMSGPSFNSQQEALAYAEKSAKVKSVPVWYSRDGMVWVREDYPDKQAAIRAAETAVRQGEQAVTSDPSKSLPKAQKTRMASTSNTSDYTPGDSAAAREHLRTFVPGQRGSDEFAKPGDRLTIVAVEPSGRLLCRNAAGKMDYFSSAQVRKTKSLKEIRKSYRIGTQTKSHNDARDYVTSVARRLKGRGSYGIDAIIQELKKHERPNDQTYYDFARQFMSDQEIERTWKEAQKSLPKAHTKSLSSIRAKYRGTKAVRRKLKSSSPGSSVVIVGRKDMDAVKEEASKRGVSVKWMGESGGGFKAKLTGDDANIDAIADQYGQPI